MEEQTKWTAVCCQKSILTIYMCCDLYLVFWLYLYSFPGMKGGRSQSWKNVRLHCEELLCWSDITAREKTFNILTTSKLSTCGCTETRASDIQGGWTLSADGSRSHEAMNERPVSLLVRWTTVEMANSIHDNTLSPGPLFWSYFKYPKMIKEQCSLPVCW